MLVADDNQSRKAEPASTLDDARTPTNLDDLLGSFATPVATATTASSTTTAARTATTTTARTATTTAARTAARTATTTTRSTASSTR